MRARTFNFRAYRYRFPERKKRYLVILLDLAVRLILLPGCWLPVFRKREIDRAGIKKILVVRNDGIGDFILSLPALQALRQSFNSCWITILLPAWQEELALASGIFDEVITFDDRRTRYLFSPARFKRLFWKMLSKVPSLRSKRFDLAIDMRGDMRNRAVIFLSGIPRRLGFDIGGMEYLLTRQVNYREKTHEVEHFLDLVRACTGTIRENNFPLNLVSTPEDQKIVAGFLENNAIRLRQDFLIIVHPVSRWPAKEWPKEKFSALCDQLAGRHKAKIVFIGAAQDILPVQGIISLMREKAVFFNATLVQLSVLLGKADLFIGNDAAPMHLAALLKIPVIALFGPTDPEIFGPYGQGHTVVKSDIVCSSCSKQACSRPQRFCMDRISVDQVLAMADQYILPNRL